MFGLGSWYFCDVIYRCSEKTRQEVAPIPTQPAGPFQSPLDGSVRNGKNVTAAGSAPGTWPFLCCVLLKTLVATEARKPRQQRSAELQKVVPREEGIRVPESHPRLGIPPGAGIPVAVGQLNAVSHVPGPQPRQRDCFA